MANPNPSPSTRFGAGNNANPQGKTSEMRGREINNAGKALKLREKMLDAMASKFEGMTDDQLTAEMDAMFLKMLKDAEDRGLGAPVQPITSPDGSMTPKPVDAALVEGLAKKLTE